MATLALLWGLIAASSVFIGAALGWFARPSPRTLAGLMAFGSGILFSVAAFEIVSDAFEDGGLWPTTFGYVIGAILFTVGLLWLDRAGARHRNRSTMAVGKGREAAGVVALATVLDSVPESLIIGVNFFNGRIVRIRAVSPGRCAEGLLSDTEGLLSDRASQSATAMLTPIEALRMEQPTTARSRLPENAYPWSEPVGAAVLA